MTRWDELPEHLAGRVRGSIGAAAVQPPQREAKYNNNKCTVDGITFDSMLEARYYQRLRLLQKAGVVKEIKLQVPFILQPSFRRLTGQLVRDIKYVADFVVTYSDGRQQVVDTKGVQTAVYKIKKKMLLYQYPDIDFVEVKEVSLK